MADMFVIMRSIEGSGFLSKKYSYQYLTKQLTWTEDINKADEFAKKNSANVLLNKVGLAKNENIIVIEKD